MTAPATLHIYATDVSALRLAALVVGARLTAVIVPENRATSDKVAELSRASPAPVLVQPRGGGLPEGCAPADVAVVWLYSQIFPADLMTTYPRGMLNMHGGRIPEYRGASVLQWAIVNGETQLGVTWHGLVEAVDAGPIWAESAVPIGSNDTAWDVRTAMIAEGIRTFPLAWSRMTEGGAPVRVPDLAGGRVWPQRRPADGRFAEGCPEKTVRDLVRALCPPWPAAVFVDSTGCETPIGRVADTAEAGALSYRTAEDRVIFLEPRLPT